MADPSFKFKYLNKIDYMGFLIGFALGMLYVYTMQPIPKIIIKHPTPKNVGKVIYHDTNDKCYKYLSEEIKCPDNGLVMNHPIVMSNDN